MGFRLKKYFVETSPVEMVETKPVEPCLKSDYEKNRIFLMGQKNEQDLDKFGLKRASQIRFLDELIKVLDQIEPDGNDKKLGADKYRATIFTGVMLIMRGVIEKEYKRSITSIHSDLFKLLEKTIGLSESSQLSNYQTHYYAQAGLRFLTSMFFYKPKMSLEFNPNNPFSEIAGYGKANDKGQIDKKSFEYLDSLFDVASELTQHSFRAAMNDGKHGFLDEKKALYAKNEPKPGYFSGFFSTLAVDSEENTVPPPKSPVAQ